MQETVESEMKSWADIVKKTNNTQRKNLTENSVKQAARLVNEEERQSKNLMIYDCPEKVGEEAWGAGCYYTATAVYKSMGFDLSQTVIDIYSLGKKEPG